MSDGKIPRVALVTKYDWPEWYNELRMAAEERLVWTHIDPEAAPSDYMTKPPVRPTYKEPAENATEKELNAADRNYSRKLKDYSIEIHDWNALHQHYLAISQWVKSTVKKEYLWAAHSRIDDSPDKSKSLQNVLKELKKHYQPAETAMRTIVRERYQMVLANASKGGVAPEAWYQECSAAYALAKVHKIPEVEGPLATKTFLKAVGERLAPQWAQIKLVEHVETEISGGTTRTLMELASFFLEQVNSGALSTAKQRSFTSLGGGGVAEQNPSTANNTGNCPCDLKKPHS